MRTNHLLIAALAIAIAGPAVADSNGPQATETAAAETAAAEKAGAEKAAAEKAAAEKAAAEKAAAEKAAAEKAAAEKAAAEKAAAEKAAAEKAAAEKAGATKPAAGKTASSTPASVPPGASGPAPTGKPAPGDRPGSERAPRISAGERQAVTRHPLLQRLSTVGAAPRFGTGTRGAWRWRNRALGEGRTVSASVSLPSGVLRTYATADASTLWISSATVRDPSAVLRLGDLLPLLQEFGVADREAALAVTQFAVSGASVPPSYTLTFRTGALWKHRAALAAAEAAGRVFYSLTSGKVTVLGALVLADGAGTYRVRKVGAEGDARATLQSALTADSCKVLETALRSAKPEAAAAKATAMLSIPNRGQACAARYLALVRPAGAASSLRKALSSSRIRWPDEMVEALVAIDPEVSEANMAAMAGLLKRTGSNGAAAVCRSAPLTWSDALLGREDVRKSTQELLRRCAMR